MTGINVGRWIGGGVAGGLLIWLLEGAAGLLYVQDMQVVLAAHNLSMEVTGKEVATSVIVSLMVGHMIVFFYAVARTHFGPGPGTAALVAVVLWLGGYVVSLLGYYVLGLFPTSMLLLWGAVGLAEMVLAAMLGGWIYRGKGTSPA